jgi:hypothetical protein
MNQQTIFPPSARAWVDLPNHMDAITPYKKGVDALISKNIIEE